MIKILSIIILSFFFCINTYADVNKWKYQDNYLTTKCFINEWPSSDNFKEFYERYFPTVKKEFSGLIKEMSPRQQSNFFFQSIGNFFPKVIPIKDTFEASWGGDQLSLTTNLVDCSSNEEYVIDKSLDFITVIDDALVYEEELPLKLKCSMFAPDILYVAKAKCLDIKTIGYNTVYTGGTMPNDVQYNTYGIYEYRGEKIILPLKFDVILREVKEDLKVLRDDFFSWLSTQEEYSNMNQLKWDDDFQIYIQQTYLDKSYRDRIEDGLSGPPNMLKYYDNKRFISGSACKQSQCITKTLVWFDTKEEKSIALIHDDEYDNKPELTIVSYDYNELPKNFVIAVRDWMIEEKIAGPKKISLINKDNKVEILNINIFN